MARIDGVLDTRTGCTIRARLELSHGRLQQVPDLVAKLHHRVATGWATTGRLAYEHEDALLDPIEGLEKGVEFLRHSVLEKPRGKLWYVD